MKPVFARVLSSLRREGGLSQKKAADELGISQALLSHYENGVREPKLEFVLKACDYYGVTTDYLLGRTTNRHMDWDSVLSDENPDIQRCVYAGSLIHTMLTDIGDERVNVDVSRYLNYCMTFVINALRAPLRPYEPLFDAAVKTAEANLLRTAAGIKDKQAELIADFSDEAIKAKYPEYYPVIQALDRLIETTVTGIRNINQASL